MQRWLHEFFIFSKKVIWDQFVSQTIEYVRHKRPRGTRWVEHQTYRWWDLRSLFSCEDGPFFIGFCYNQISTLHDAQMKKTQSKLES